MAWKSALIGPFARLASRRLDRDLSRSADWQARTFEKLVRQGRKTLFGREHDFDSICTYEDFKARVPLRDYEGLRPWIEKIIGGETSVLWPGKPRFFAKTSGTTSGAKYIPITRASIPNHIGSARNALFNYMTQTGNGRFFDGKMIFLSGSPVLEKKGEIPTGRLSGIVNHLVPAWVRSNQLPSYETNCVEDWNKKLERVVAETSHRDMRLISGIPPWVEMYYEHLLDYTGKASVGEIFPNYSLFVHGGVNYAPYAAKLADMVGKPIDTLETYPASEGFIAFQDRWPSEGLRLNIASGIFYEFVPLEEIGKEQPARLQLIETEPGRDYALVINSNAGLWGYNIGDTVRFTTTDPPRLVVSGRIKHFISAFGEHVIGKEVDEAMRQVCEKTGASVVEFTVAPQVDPEGGGLPYHEWFVEFAEAPGDLEAFRHELDRAMVDQNIYYRDLIEGNILRPLVIRLVRPSGFREHMASVGKLGGQNKVPRLLNDRSLAELMEKYADG